MKSIKTFVSFLLVTLVITTPWNIINAQNKAERKGLTIEKQIITVPDFKAEGYILDIGGGGEGVIGQLKGDQTISIDPLKQELVEAPSTNLKIVMDGRDLKFIDESFNTAVSFYTFMYINGRDHEKVFNEVKRVLKPKGRFLIWDVNLPTCKDTSYKYIMYPFNFKLPKKEINTGYGVKFAEKEQNLDYYIDLAKRTGFKVINSSKTEHSFFLEIQKTL